MIRMSKATRTHTPGKQLDCDILISSLMKHVLTNRPMFHSDSEKLRSTIRATKSSLSNQTWHIKMQKKFDMVSVIWCSFVFSSFSVFMLLEPLQNCINFFKRRVFDLDLLWRGGLDFRAKNLLIIFNDGTNCRPVSLTWNWTETIMYFKKKISDSIHRHTCHWSWGATTNPP